jgi:E3 ubiquitin-protein ligase HUWE1
LKNNTIYENYNTETHVIKWFWELMDSYDNNERAEFLQFVTGSSKVPLEGFSALQGIGGINKFKISKVFDKNFDRLPTAHTW